MHETIRQLTALSPLDGRYREQLEELSNYCSEFALNRYRVLVEVEYFIALQGAIRGDLGPLDPGVFAELRALYEGFSPEDAYEIKRMERKTNHDLKAVEYYLKERISALPGLAGEIEKVHFGLTSEDVNNLAYALMHRDMVHEVLLPALTALLEAMRNLAGRTRKAPMLARTHGQSATPTTMGKELAVHVHRLACEIEGLHHIRLSGKLNGATGTFGALHAAYPEIDWMAFSHDFVRRLDLSANLVTTQIEPHDRLATLCDALRHINNILLDFDQDMWRYISDGYFRQVPRAGEVGSSAMPHKVNPIDFENSEGNLGLANALLSFFSDKLTKSRLQRDLSDSTVLRNVGSAFGYSLLAYRSALKGISKVALDAERLSQDLAAHPEVLAEAYQTVLRAHGHFMPYERLKELTRGQSVTLEAMRAFVAELDLDEETKARLLSLTPADHVGLSVQVAEWGLSKADEVLLHLRACHC